MLFRKRRMDTPAWKKLGAHEGYINFKCYKRQTLALR